VTAGENTKAYTQTHTLVENFIFTFALDKAKSGIIEKKFLTVQQHQQLIPSYRPGSLLHPILNSPPTPTAYTGREDNSLVIHIYSLGKAQLVVGISAVQPTQMLFWGVGVGLGEEG
jgi:hypothetical protein